MNDSSVLKLIAVGITLMGILLNRSSRKVLITSFHKFGKALNKEYELIPGIKIHPSKTLLSLQAFVAPTLLFAIAFGMWIAAGLFMLLLLFKDAFSMVNFSFCMALGIYGCFMLKRGIIEGTNRK